MKKLFVMGAVCLGSLASCRTHNCPAYTKADSGKNHQTQLIKTDTAPDKNRS